MIGSDVAASVRHVGRVSTGVRARLRMSGAGGLSFLGACLFAAAASAASDAPRTETFTGFKAPDNYSSGYVGGSYALSKTGLYEPGFRLRAVGAYGRYHYGRTLPGDDGEVPVTFDGEDAFLSALVGYQFRPGRLIVKLFAGIEAEDQHIVPHDPHNSVQGRELGVRLQAETWLDISPSLFLSADARLRHRLPGILQPCAAWASREAAALAGARGRCAWQRGI